MAVGEVWGTFHESVMVMVMVGWRVVVELSTTGLGMSPAIITVTTGPWWEAVVRLLEGVSLRALEGKAMGEGGGERVRTYLETPRNNSANEGEEKAETETEAEAETGTEEAAATFTVLGEKELVTEATSLA